jgi:hypothetical protein
MHDAAVVCRLHGRGQRGYQSRSLACRLRPTRQFLAQAASLDELHREIRPTLVFGHVVNLHDVHMPQTCHGFRFALKPCEFVRRRIGIGEQHLQPHGSVKAQVPGFVNDAHAAVAEHGLHFIARDSRQVGVQTPRIWTGGAWVVRRRWE